MSKKTKPQTQKKTQDYFSDDKIPYYILGIVAIVAVVGLLVYFSGGKTYQAVQTNTLSQLADISGQASGIDADKIYPEDYAVTESSAEEPKSWPFN